MKHLGKALVYLRNRRELTATEVSERSGVTKPMLSGYERNINRPSVETLAKILHGLGADFTELDDALAVVQGDEVEVRPENLLGSLLASEQSRVAFAEVLRSVQRLCASMLNDLGYVDDPKDQDAGN